MWGSPMPGRIFNKFGIFGRSMAGGGGEAPP
jgi:hypothetical protein